MSLPIITTADAPPPGLLRGWTLAAERNLHLQLRALPARLRRTSTKPRHLITGERGEFEAMFFLRRLGYHFVERRWRAPELRGDLDLIGWDGKTLCFVEVKARTARDLAPARSGVDAQKQRMLRRMAGAYRRTLPRAQRQTIPTRFDVVSVYLLQDRTECELARAVFGWRDDDAERSA